MTDKPCAFCEAYKSHCQADSISDQYQDKEDREQYGKHMRDYTVALVQHHWYKKLGKRTAGRSTDYRNKGLGFKLNFCPECGADLRGDAEEPKKCDTCRHEKSQWFNRCADCSDYELWEGKKCQR